MDAVLYLRPDVYGEGAVVASHPARHNHTNAALVTVNGTDQKQVDVRVGFGRNLNVTLGVETTVNGAGHTATFRAGDAVGAGPSAGGDLILQPGVGIGGGINGQVLPYANAVVTLGNATTVFGTVFGRNFRGDSGQNVEVRSVQTGAGAGPNVTLLAADGGGAGPTNGGNVVFQPGAPAGAGTRGEVLVNTAALTNLRPSADGLLNLGAVVGGAQFQLNNVLTYSVQSRDGGLSINALRLTAGVGDTVFVFGGDASGAGNAGGNLELGPGIPGAGGAQGNVIFSTSGLGAYNVRPDVTNLVSLGDATRAFANVRTRILQADAGQSMLLNRGDGTLIATILNASNPAIQFSLGVQYNDGVNTTYGSGVDFTARWSTASANNLMMFTTGVNSAAQSGNVILTTAANVSQEHGLAAVLTPRFSIFSAADMSVAGNRTQHIQWYHDGTDGYALVGAGSLYLQHTTGGNGVRVRNSASANYGNLVTSGGSNEIFSVLGGTGITSLTLGYSTHSLTIASSTGTSNDYAFTQRVHTSGTPTGLLWTAAAHTALAAGVESIDWNVNLARTVQFTTGATIALQRGVFIQGPTWSATAATQTFTNAATLFVQAPTAGTNAAFTQTYAIATAGNLSVGYQGELVNRSITIWSSNGSNKRTFITNDGNGTDYDNLIGNQRIRFGPNGSTNNFEWHGPGPAINMALVPQTTGQTLFTLTQPVNTTGSPTGLLFTAGAHTTLATAEATDFDLHLARSVQFTTGGGSIATQRAGRVRAPTYTATAATLTFTDATTWYLEGPPVAGTNVSITNPWTLWVDAGNVRFDGQLAMALGSGSAPAYSFQGDLNTGLWSSAADTLDFATGGGANARLQIDTEAGAGNTALLVGVAGAAPIRVSVGANDSGGAGFRVLRVPN